MTTDNSESEADGEERVMAEDQPRTPIRVLILEDEEDDALIMLHHLNLAGFDPTWTRVDNEEGYLAGLSPDLDLILADFHQPQFDALCALYLRRERGLDVPVIIVSGAIGEEQAVECLKQGASDYLIKDRLGRLGRAVAQVLRERKLREERRRDEVELREISRELAATNGRLEAVLARLQGKMPDPEKP